MKASINTLGHVLYAPSQYVIPVFQRNYRWDQPQWERLWTSLMEIQQSAKTGNHFMGFLVFVQDGITPPGQHSKFHLIDGQQRLTTTSLLLAAIRNVARVLEDESLSEEIHMDYLVHVRKKGSQHFRLLPKTQDAEAFQSIILAASPTSGRMADAVEYFESKVTGYAEGDTERLRALFDLVCQRLEFMYATLEGENAYSIFKSLNSTGVPLSQSDLIRNFVFMHVKPEEQDDFDAELWTLLEQFFVDGNERLIEERFSQFFRDWMMADGEYIQPKATFTSFESRFEGSNFDPSVLVRSLIADAQRYQVICGAAADGDKSVSQAIANLNALDSSTTYPLLLTLMRLRDTQKLTNGELAETIQMLSGFLLRRFVANESSRSYGRVFVRALHDADDDIVGSLRQFLLEKGWPHDEKFKADIASYPIYKSNYARHILERLERSSGHKEGADLSAAQIEHVMPQTLTSQWQTMLGESFETDHSEWLHRLGNLTLSAYNQEVGNQPFEVKRERFEDSNVGLTRDISKSSVWTSAEIESRGVALSEVAKDLWSGPQDPFTPESVVNTEINIKQERLDFWTEVFERVKAIDSDIPVLDAKPRRTRRFPARVPNILVESRYKVAENSVHVDVYFMKSAQKVLNAISMDPSFVNQLIDDTWQIESAPSGRYGWITISMDAPNEGRVHWPMLQSWLVHKLSLVYGKVLPYLALELKSNASSASGSNGGVRNYSETQLLQRRFWEKLSKHLSATTDELTPQKPLPQNWTNYSIGRTGFSLMGTINMSDNRLSAIVNIDSATPKEHFRALLDDRAAIENDFGGALDWRELPDRNSSRIVVTNENCDPRDEGRWDDYVGWMSDALLRLNRTFRDRIEKLA